MQTLRKVLARTALVAAVIGGTAVLTAGSAEARVVCNAWHCWHVYGPPYYDPYYDPYYGGYYGPSGVSLGFSFGGGGHHWHGGSHGGWHGGGGHRH